MLLVNNGILSVLLVLVAWLVVHKNLHCKNNSHNLLMFLFHMCICMCIDTDILLYMCVCTCVFVCV